MTKQIPLKAITINFNKTWSIVPESHMFDEWECPPDQEAFESMMLNEFFDSILEDVRGNGRPMDYTDVKQFEEVVVRWEEDND